MTRDQTRSASVVALLADIPSTGHLGAAQAQRFTLDGHDLAERAGPFVDYVGHHASRGVKVVALYPRWRREQARRAVAFARGALREDAVAGVDVDLSPLALSLIADQLAYLCPYLPAGMIAGLADELPRHTLAGGWLRNVANLATIPISVPQHLGSFAPGVTYLALCSPLPQVARVPKGETAARLPFRPQDPLQVLYSSGPQTDTSAFEQQFLAPLQAVAARRLPPQPLGPAYWGSPKYAEFVAFSAHPRALTEPARTVRPATCSWCGEPTIVPVCRFCGAANTLPAQRPAAPAPNAAPAPLAPAAQSPPPEPAGHPPARTQAPPAPGPHPERPAAEEAAPQYPPGHAPSAPAPAGEDRDSFAGTPDSGPQRPRRPRPPEPVEDEDLPVPQALPPLPHDPDGPAPGGRSASASAGPAHPGAAPPGFRLQAAPEAAARPASALPDTAAGTGPRSPGPPGGGPGPDRPSGPQPRHPDPTVHDTGDPHRDQDVSVPRAPR
ncbi:hypothetical protein [Streptomonospora wellingtoniae]|uniref:Uncharacterized protein n=1 Tax=Streptomonospora wellingtoniae TaxID=3075544 RepID=A0ABU2KYH6_9ACTN|nr:hypothetical protein [Streptomonospora sp. DSM 45055]MDT0304123.1 hypothetical protein [Streptomonospora sp. DSM 45055]